MLFNQDTKVSLQTRKWLSVGLKVKFKKISAVIKSRNDLSNHVIGVFLVCNGYKKM